MNGFGERVNEAVVIQLAADLVRKQCQELGDHVTEAEALAMAREMHQLLKDKTKLLGEDENG